MCQLINVNNDLEMEEFSLYCIVEGDAFTMPLAKEEYILDVTTELHKNQQVRHPTNNSAVCNLKRKEALIQALCRSFIGGGNPSRT